MSIPDLVEKFVQFNLPFYFYKVKPRGYDIKFTKKLTQNLSSLT